MINKINSFGFSLTELESSDRCLGRTPRDRLQQEAEWLETSGWSKDNGPMHQPTAQLGPSKPMLALCPPQCPEIIILSYMPVCFTIDCHMLLSLTIQFVPDQSKYNLADKGWILFCVIHIQYIPDTCDYLELIKTS